jgi:uncharacterized membrane protein YhaH (DUF805 family)
MLNFLFNPNGRVSRVQFWMWFIFPQVVLSFVAQAADAAIFGVTMSPNFASEPFDAAVAPPVFGFTLVVGLFYLWPSIAVSVKRFHDRGMTGWWVLWFGLIIFGGAFFAIASAVGASVSGQSTGALPLLGGLLAGGAMITQFVILYVLPGAAGANKFGPDPRNPGASGSASVDDGSSGGADWADKLLDGDGLVEARASAAATMPTSAPSTVRVSAPSTQSARRARRAAPPAAGGPASFGRRGV